MIDIARTMKFEGKRFVHHPLDRGGPTRFGITMGALARYLGRKVTEEDVRKITAHDAWKFYTAFAKQYRIDKIGSGQIASQVFDASVHHGPRQAGLWLQRSINAVYVELGRNNVLVGLKLDGIIGSRTRAALKKANVRKVNNQIVRRRVQFMARLVTRDPGQSVFLSGWVRRALSYMV